MMREESWLTVFHNARAGQVYDSNPTQFTLAPAPSGPAGIGSIAGVSGYAILKGAPNYDLSVAFLEYLTSPSAQEFFANQNYEFPVVEGVETGPVAASLGDFKSDTLNLNALGENQPDAQRIFNEVGFP